MKIGDPLDRSTDHGPQNHKAHLDKLLEYCEVGVKEGATLVYGGRQVDRPGTIKTLTKESRRLTSMNKCSWSLMVNMEPLHLPTGFFMEPTVFSDVEDHMFIAKEESFGPVMVVSKFQDG